MIQQMQRVVAGPSRPSVYSRLNFGQSSSNHEKQPPQPTKALVAHEILAHVKGKAQIKQVYVPKKKKMPSVPTQRIDPPTSFTIGSARVPIIEINEQIMIEEQLQR